MMRFVWLFLVTLISTNVFAMSENYWFYKDASSGELCLSNGNLLQMHVGINAVYTWNDLF